DTRDEILDHHVALPRQIQNDGPRLGAREIERDAALADVDPHEIRRLVLAPGLELRVAAASVIAFAPFDLDDVGAEIGEQTRAVGTGEDPGEVEHGEAGQRTVDRRHGRLVYTRCGPSLRRSRRVL